MAAPTIFISYRRDDTQGHAGRLYDRLADRFGERRVFLDVGAIAAGDDFVETIRAKVKAADVVLALIGPRWASATDAEGKWRLADDHDYVRLEIATALEHKLRVIPILLQGAPMPRASDLPGALAGLASRQAFDIREASFEHDVSRLLDSLAPRWVYRVARRMRRAPVVAVAGVLAVALAGVALAPRVSRLAMTPEQARIQLVQMGLAYDRRSFIDAVERDDERAVRLFIEAGMQPQTGYESAAMRAAAKNRNLRLLELFIDHGATPGAALPASVRDLATFEWLMARRPAKAALTEALYPATHIGVMEPLAALVKAGADVNAVVGGSTPLMDAADMSNFAAAQLLLAHGANPRAKGKDDMTALHSASDSYVRTADGARQRRAILQLLVQSGADLEARTTSTATPLLIALSEGAPELVPTLVELGADVNARMASSSTGAGQTALMAAVRAGSPDVVRLLLDRGADVNARNDQGETALSIAAAESRDDRAQMAKLLLERGASARESTDGGSPVLMRAAVNTAADPALIPLLIAAGADPDAADPSGRTALMVAVEVQNLAGVRALLSAGARTNGTRADGKSARTLAAESGNRELIEMVARRGQARRAAHAAAKSAR